MAISHEILILPGDGIGVEVVPVAQEIMEVVAGRLGIKLVFEKALVGGKAIDEMGEPLPKDTLDLAIQSYQQRERRFGRTSEQLQKMK